RRPPEVVRPRPVRTPLAEAVPSAAEARLPVRRSRRGAQPAPRPADLPSRGPPILWRARILYPSAGGRDGDSGCYVRTPMRRFVPLALSLLSVGVVAPGCKGRGPAVAEAAPPPSAPADARASAPAARVFARKYGAMGTEITLSAWTANEPAAQHAFAAAHDEIPR